MLWTSKGSVSSDAPAKNTDREIWRAVPEDYYSPSIHVTEGGGIGINVGGLVIVMPVERWHACGNLMLAAIQCAEKLTSKKGAAHSPKETAPKPEAEAANQKPQAGG
jgi:hypothetical protein